MEYSVEKTVDALGRVVIPKEMRNYYGITSNAKVRLIPIDEGILLVRPEASETFDNNDKSFV
jgi:AbrB family looped-hinge helix DNA binding protein